MNFSSWFKGWPVLAKPWVKPLLFTWLACSGVGSLALLPLNRGKLPASVLGGATVWPEIWQRQWWAVHKFLALLGQIAWWQWILGILLIFAWGILFCFCLGRGLGHGQVNYFPTFQPTLWRKGKLLVLRAATALFALGAGAFLFGVPILVMVGAISFWPNNFLAGLLIILLWTLICVVYIFPCIWADVLIVCHSPLPAQWPSNELYHRFLGAVSSHWRITRYFILAQLGLGILLLGWMFGQNFAPYWGTEGMLLFNLGAIFILGLAGSFLAYGFGRHVAYYDAPALLVISGAMQEV